MGFSSPGAMSSAELANVGGGPGAMMTGMGGAIGSSGGGMSDYQALGLGMQGIGGVTGAVGAYDSTSAKQGMLSMDATIAGYQSSQALNSGAMQEENQELKTGALFGQQRANLAANGVQLGSGSALDVLSSTKYMGDLEANTIHNNALRSAWGYQQQASIDKYAASSLNPTAAGLTSLLGSAGSVAKSWYSIDATNGGM